MKNTIAILVIATTVFYSGPAGDRAFADVAVSSHLEACTRLLDDYYECSVSNSASTDAICRGIAGRELIECMLLEGSYYGDAPGQIRALEQINAVSSGVKHKIYNGVIEADPDVLLACHSIIKGLTEEGVVRRAVLTSVCRTGSHQRRLYRSARYPAARASMHQLGLACDVAVSGYRGSFDDVADAARRILKSGSAGRMGGSMTVTPEPGVKAIHVQPRRSSRHFQEVMAVLIKRLIEAGMLPRRGTMTNRPPPFSAYSDVRRQAQRR